MALLPQNPAAPEGPAVRDLVARGRHPHQRWFRQWSPEDEQVVELALEHDRHRRPRATGRSTSSPAVSGSAPGSR